MDAPERSADRDSAPLEGVRTREQVGTGESEASGKEAVGRRHERRPERRRPAQGTIPAWVLVPLAAGVGWIVSGWMGGIFGALLGTFLWLARRAS